MVNTTILSVNTIFHFLAEWIQCRAYDQYFSSSNSTGVCCYWLNELNFFYRYSYSIPKLQILRLYDICTVVYHYIFHNLKDFFRRVIPPNCQIVNGFYRFSWFRQRAHAECDQSAEVAHSAMASQLPLIV